MTQPTLSPVPAETVPADAPQISVVVPVYKVEKFVAECLESILAQDFDSFEVVAVDDGSPDASGKICDEFAARDSRLRVFHKENGGVTSARRLGVERSRGEWICFVDSDDVLLPHALSVLFAGSKDFPDADLVEGTFVNFRENKELSCEALAAAVPARGNGGEKPFSASGPEYAREIAADGKFCVGPYPKIIRRDVILKTGALNIPAEIIWGEDRLLCLALSSGTRRAVRLPEIVYAYRRHPNGVCVASASLYCSAERQALFYKTAQQVIGQQDADRREIFLIFLAKRLSTAALARNSSRIFLKHQEIRPFIAILKSQKCRKYSFSLRLVLLGTQFPFTLLPEKFFRMAIRVLVEILLRLRGRR